MQLQRNLRARLRDRHALAQRKMRTVQLSLSGGCSSATSKSPVASRVEVLVDVWVIDFEMHGLLITRRGRRSRAVGLCRRETGIDSVEIAAPVGGKQ